MTINNRIVGGELTTIAKHPHQVALIYAGDFICGGSIIKSNRILTAAHCVYKITNSNLLSIRAGSTNYKTGGQFIGVEKIIRHENYDNNRVINDIAILYLKNGIQLGTAYSTSIISIPNSGETIKDGSIGIVTGWGAIQENGYAVDVLRMVNVPVISNAKCNMVNEYNGIITENMLCAGYAAGGRDSCQGDSGGPFVIGGRVVGIVSFGIKNWCGHPNIPGVYTRVSQYNVWIKKYL